MPYCNSLSAALARVTISSCSVVCGRPRCLLWTKCTPPSTRSCDQWSDEQISCCHHFTYEVKLSTKRTAAAVSVRRHPLSRDRLSYCGTGAARKCSTSAPRPRSAPRPAGVPVAKHGNRHHRPQRLRRRARGRSTSTRLTADAGPASTNSASASLPRRLRTAMRHVAAVRKAGHPHDSISSAARPANATHQLLGRGRPELRPLLACVARLGTERTRVLREKTALATSPLPAQPTCPVREIGTRDFTYPQIPRHPTTTTGLSVGSPRLALSSAAYHGDAGPARASSSQRRRPHHLRQGPRPPVAAVQSAQASTAARAACSSAARRSNSPA